MTEHQKFADHPTPLKGPPRPLIDADGNPETELPTTGQPEENE